MKLEQAFIYELDFIEKIQKEKHPEHCTALLDMLQIIDTSISTKQFDLKPRDIRESIREGKGDFQKLQKNCLDLGLI